MTDKSYKWIASATYDDGTSVEKEFSYAEKGIYSLEDERQHELEEWLIEQHEGCNWYSVACVEDI